MFRKCLFKHLKGGLHGTQDMCVKYDLIIKLSTDFHQLRGARTLWDARHVCGKYDHNCKTKH